MTSRKALWAGRGSPYGAWEGEVRLSGSEGLTLPPSGVPTYHPAQGPGSSWPFQLDIEMRCVRSMGVRWLVQSVRSPSPEVSLGRVLGGDPQERLSSLSLALQASGETRLLAGVNEGAAHQAPRTPPWELFTDSGWVSPELQPPAQPRAPGGLLPSRFHSSILKSGLWPQFPFPCVPQTVVGSSKAPSCCPAYTPFPVCHPLASELNS